MQNEDDFIINSALRNISAFQPQKHDITFAPHLLAVFRGQSQEKSEREKEGKRERESMNKRKHFVTALF